jgi:uncharacterized protein YegL
VKQDYTDLTVILDRSGSMESIARDMEGGFNRFIADQRKLPGECKVSLTQFDTESVDVVYTATDIQQVPSLRLIARGGTPLLDAVGTTVTKAGERLAALPEEQRPGRVLVLVITDGQENSSREWTKDKVKSLIDQQQKDYNWAFVFLGANIDSFAEAGAMGFAAASTANYQPDSAGVNAAFATLDSNFASYRAAAPAAAPKQMAFSQKQRKQMKEDEK